MPEFFSPPKGTERQIVDRLIVDVRHAGLDLLREAHAALDIGSEHALERS